MIESKVSPHEEERRSIRLRSSILASLKLGSQAPGYKAARKALDQFIKEAQGHG